MKRQFVVISSLTLCLTVALMMMSCTTGPQNVNQNQNQNQNKAGGNANASNASTLSVSQDPCQDTNLATKKQKLETALVDKVKGDVTGKNPLASQYNNNFYLEFVEGTTGAEKGYVIIVVSGAIEGKDQVTKLSDFIEDFVKSDCKIKAVFKAKTPNIAADDPIGFEWCEAPLRACPGGYCAEVCLPLDPGVNANANSNRGANSNSNANANPNSNRP